MTRLLGISLAISLVLITSAVWGASGNSKILPGRGLCAHRGASATHPENTLAALREAVRLGAHMIEFDVARARDGELVLMHDASVDRTTDGTGAVAELTWSDLKNLDAGSWKGSRFRGERVPTLNQALSIMPENVWLNVHIKGDAALAQAAAGRLASHDRLHQAFLACSAAAAAAARQVSPRIKICNMDRRTSVRQYVEETIELRADFIQLLASQKIDRKLTRQLAGHRVRINYCCAADAETLRGLFAAGVEFPLVDDVDNMLNAAEQLGIQRLDPVYRAKDAATD